MKGLFDVDEAGINDVVELLNRANAQAIRNDFGKKTDGEDPVIHFYEHFLGVYDKELKVERGVFYTPRDVVSYIVRSVHELLQKEFGLEDGLADTSTWAEVKELHKDLKIPEGIKPDIEPFVQILDPATGTATFLIEVIDVIHNTMTEKWDKERVSKAEQIKKWNTYVPTHLLPRLFAYELMMAPYAIAHMKVGLKLTETGFTAWDKLGPENRANIFLTNALEPWSSQQELPGFNALAHEAASVNAVKRNKRFTVIIGNPPYSALSANLTAENRRLVDRYRQINGVKIKERSMLQFEKNIQDDYIKFFVFSESTTEEACHGIVGFITNHSYIDGPTLRGMRASLVNTFTQVDIVDLHGNSNKKESQLRVDENVFEIQQGVAVALLRRGLKTEKCFYVGHLYGTRKEKYEFLRSHSIHTTTKSPFDPRPDFYHFIAFESNSRAEYERFLQLEKVFLKNSMGTKTGFNELLLDFTRNGLIEKISRFGDHENPEDELREEFNAKAGHAALVLEKR
jgi:predicted helicase